MEMVWMKRVIVMLAILSFLVAGCSTNQDIGISSNDACMVGCLAGINHDGIDFQYIDPNDQSDEKIQEYNSCKEFCFTLDEVGKHG